jgi:hypothetical protein
LADLLRALSFFIDFPTFLLFAICILLVRFGHIDPTGAATLYTLFVQFTHQISTTFVTWAMFRRLFHLRFWQRPARLSWALPKALTNSTFAEKFNACKG